MLITSHGVLVNFSKYFVMLHTFRKVVFWIFFFFFFFLSFRFMCIEMLPVFQRVKSIHGTQTGFSLFSKNYQSSCVETLLHWNEGSTLQKKKKKKKKMNLREYSIRTIIEDICNNILFSVKCFSSGYCPLFPIRQFVFEL